VTLTPATLLDPSAAAVPEPPPLSPLPQADRAVADLRAAQFRRGVSEARGALAADAGHAEGARLEPAWRRDRSTLRSRLLDGASLYQRNRETTSRASSSPQALRQERVTGVGDSTRSRTPRADEPSSTAALPPEDGQVDGQEDRRVEPHDSPQPMVNERSARAGEAGQGAHRGEGPLAAARGQRSFDVETAGPTADNAAVRAASNEARPGLTDYTAVSSPGPEGGLLGRGVGDAPGVVSAPSSGTAPAPSGQLAATAPAEASGAAAAEREYLRVFHEIRRRVERSLRFPKRLALELQQGEAVVQFRVEADGRLGGEVKLLKSAGFEEFDREALDIVRRSAPFPPLRRAVVFRMPVTFENPLIR
jgi:TonB family protein